MATKNRKTADETQTESAAPAPAIKLRAGSIIAKSLNEATGSVTLTAPSLGKTLTVTLADLAPGIRDRAALHGLAQKLGDAAAISRNPETGLSATPAEKWAEVVAVFERIMAGQWNAESSGGGFAGGQLLQALIRVYPAKTPEALRAYVEGKTPAERRALETVPAIATALATIRAEAAARAAAGVNPEALAGELDNL